MQTHKKGKMASKALEEKNIQEITVQNNSPKETTNNTDQVFVYRKRNIERADQLSLIAG